MIEHTTGGNMSLAELATQHNTQPSSHATENGWRCVSRFCGTRSITANEYHELAACPLTAPVASL